MADLFRKPRASAVRLVIYIVLFTGIAAGLNAWIFMTGGADWSRALVSPPWSPPGPVVGTVWIVLFALMATSLWLVDRDGQLQARSGARSLIALQYLINISWPLLYFGLESIAAGFFVTAIAWLVSLASLITIWRASRGAALLFVPLTLWLSFALYLSFATWQLNA